MIGRASLVVTLATFGAYLPPGAGPWLLLVPGPTLPELEGFAAVDPLFDFMVLDFMLAPVVMDD